MHLCPLPSAAAAIAALATAFARRPRSTAQGAPAIVTTPVLVLVVLVTLVAMTIPCASAASRSAIGAGGMSGVGLYDTWSVGYLYRQDLVAIEYDSTTGTEGAMERYFAAGRSDFAGLDYGLDDATLADISSGTWQAARADPNDDTDGNQAWVPGSGVLQVPVAAVPWVFAYRLGALQTAGHTAPLVLSGPLVARMWMGEITAWNHPDLVALNPVLAAVTTPLALFCEASLYGSTALLGATLDALYAPFAVWRASIASDPIPWYQVAATIASSTANGSLSIVAVTGGPNVLLANATATDGSIVFGAYAATRRAGAPLTPAASMRNPAGKTVTPTADAVAAALDDFAGAISAAAPDRMHEILPAGGAGTASWPMAAFALMAIATDVEAADCTYITYVLDFLGWALLNQQAADAVAAADAFVIVPPRFAKNAIDLMGDVRCNGAAAFTAALIIGSGSPTPVYSLWAYAYDADPTADGATVHYTETRGNRAKAQILAGDVDFGPTNNDVEPEVHAAHPDLALVPVGAYPVVFCYNVPGLMKGGAPALVLSVDVAMRILLAEITRWNHPDIAALNPDLASHLPDADILFVGKTGSSIYTGTVSRAFALHSPAFAATYGNGSNNVAWPVAATNRSVVSTLDEYVDTLKTTPYAIAYTAHHVVLRQRNLREARFLNADGSAPLEPTRETTLAAVDQVAAARGGIGSLDRLSFVVGATGPHAWPMANMALVLIHTATMPDPVRARQLVRWLYWTQTSSAAVHISNVTGVYGIADLPDVWSDVLATLVNVTVQGVHVNPLRPCFADGLLCSNAGTCDETAGRCACNEGRAGAYCETAASNSSTDGTGWSSGETAAVAASVSVAVVALVCVACALAIAALIATRRRGRGRENWEIDADDIDLTEATVLGAGGYGVVYRTAWRGTDVAVKIMSPDTSGAAGSEARRAFADEVRVMCALRHPNVVLFMAACTRPPKMCIVMEYMALGSLFDLLHNELVPEVPHALVVKMAYQAAKGMHFLHSSGVVHRDLKSLNLLLDAKWNVKVSDFGLTRFKSDLARAAGGDAVQGTVQWLAPEVLDESTNVDYMQADVYAFGIVLWEMTTRCEPYAGMSPASIAVSVIRDDARPPLPKLAPADYVALVQECWHRDPVMRPAFVDIQRRLTDAIKNDASSSSSSSSSRSGALGLHQPHHHYQHHYAHGDATSSSSSSSSSFSMTSIKDATLSGSSVHRVDRRGDSADAPLATHARSRTLSNAMAGFDGQGTVAIVVADVDRADALWEAHPEAMRDATLLCNDLLRDLARKHSGVEVGIHGAATTGAGCMCVVFCDPARARAWCADAQVALLDAPWPRALLDAHEAAAEVWTDTDHQQKQQQQQQQQDTGKSLDDEPARRRLYAGLRVRMAIHVGRPRWHREPGALPACSGVDVHLCCRLAANAAGGRVLLTADAANDIKTIGDAAGHPKEEEEDETEATAKQQQHQPYSVSRVARDSDADRGSDGGDDDDDAGPSRDASVYELRPRALDARRFGQVTRVTLPDADPTHSSQSASITAAGDDSKASTGVALLASANACRWIIAYDEIDLREHVGAGSCAMVYRGRWKGIDVAVKRFANQRVDERRRIEFRAETAALAAVHHPYVVAFVGACVAPPDLCVVTEFVRRGSMRRVLDDPTLKIKWTERMRMLRTAAVGVAHLHGVAGIVHRDLKSSNLLVADDWSIKVADFGFARIKEANTTMTRCGTPCWTAPEIIRGARYSEKVDVYSFGIVMWEVVTRRRPFADRGFADVALAVLDGVRPAIPSSCPTDLAKLMSACWDTDPDARPSMEEVVKRLDAIALDMDRRDTPSLRPDIERGSF